MQAGPAFDTQTFPMLCSMLAAHFLCHCYATPVLCCLVLFLPHSMFHSASTPSPLPLPADPGAVEAHLVARARLPATLPEISAGLRQTTVAVRRLRVGLLAARVAGACITAGATLKQQMVYTAYQRLREEQQQWQRRQQRRQEAAEDSDWEQGGGFEGVPVQEGAAVAGRVVVAAAGVTAAAEPTQRQRD
jgi:hypothetical protein